MKITFDMNKRYYALYKKYCSCSFNEFLNICIDFFLDANFECFKEEREQEIFAYEHENLFQETKKKFKTFDDFVSYLELKKDEFIEPIRKELMSRYRRHYDLEKN